MITIYYELVANVTRGLAQGEDLSSEANSSVSAMIRLIDQTADDVAVLAKAVRQQHPYARTFMHGARLLVPPLFRHNKLDQITESFGVLFGS